MYYCSCSLHSLNSHFKNKTRFIEFFIFPGTGALRKLTNCKTIISTASKGKADIKINDNDIITIGKFKTCVSTIKTYQVLHEG